LPRETEINSFSGRQTSLGRGKMGGEENVALQGVGHNEKLGSCLGDPKRIWTYNGRRSSIVPQMLDSHSGIKVGREEMERERGGGGCLYRSRFWKAPKSR